MKTKLDNLIELSEMLREIQQLTPNECCDLEPEIWYDTIGRIGIGSEAADVYIQCSKCGKKTIWCHGREVAILRWNNGEWQ